MTKNNSQVYGVGARSNANCKPSLLVVALMVTASLTASFVTSTEANNGNTGTGIANRAYAIGLWGDMPYSDLQAQEGVPNLIADMNSQKLAFTVHDGDLKAGNGTPGSETPTTCVDNLYVQALGYFNSLQSAAVFTPGDNDWTDCDRAKNGGYSSRERLDYERQLFFSTAYSLGQDPIQQEVQTEKICLDDKGNKVGCVENRRWIVNGVVYATLNIQGSCNNLCDTAPDAEEWAARNQADILWMQQTFDEAETGGASAIMFISQANPGWDNADSTRAPTRDPKTLVENDGQPDGFKDFLLALREQVIAFRKPVAYIHGDSHYFRVDKPFLDANGRRLENFTRVETFGDNAANGNNDVHWVKVLVDDRTHEVFSFQPQIVPANRIAFPQL